MSLPRDKWHVIMLVPTKNDAGTAELVCLWPMKDDDNAGLPDWFFETTVLTNETESFYDNFECDLSKDTVEWIPAIGPAPCWEGKISDYETFDDLYAAFYKWLGETY